MNKPDTEPNIASENTHTKSWQIIAEVLTSILCAALFIDMPTFAFIGIFSLPGLVLIPGVFAFPIIIGKFKLLLIPIGTFIIVFIIFFIMGYSNVILFFSMILGFLGGFGAVIGGFIKWLLYVKKTKKVNKNVIIILVLLSAIILVPFILQPLRLPSPLLRLYIQRHASMGAYIDDVVDMIRGNEDWWLRYTRRTEGVRRHDLRGNSYVVGDKYVVARVGSYFPGNIWTFFLPTRVDIYWVFDEDGKLFRIFVQRSLDL